MGFLQPSADRDIIALIKTEIEKNIGEPIRIKDLVKSVGMNKHTLTDLFSSLEGCTIHAYHIRLRMRVAEEMLTHTGETVSRIAYETGYSSARTFYKAFKKYYGLSPHQYRADKAK